MVRESTDSNPTRLPLLWFLVFGSWQGYWYGLSMADLSRAGAHWHTHATPEDPRACDWDVQTYEYWVGVLEREGRDEQLPKAGLKVKPPTPRLAMRVLVC